MQIKVELGLWALKLRKCLYMAVFCFVSVYAYAQDEWPHQSKSWSDELFRARVQGVYDWTGSGPDRVILFEYLAQRETGIETVDMPLYQIPTANREIEFFPTRDQAIKDGEATYSLTPNSRHQPPPKDWLDREHLIRYLRGNEVIEQNFFEDKIDEDAGPDTYYLMGNIYFLQNRYTEAIENYQEAIERFPRFQFAHKNMAFAYFLSGDCESSLATARTAIQLGAFSATIKGVEGYCSLLQGDHQSAVEALSIARMLDHKNATLLDLQIEALIQLGKYRQAKILLNAAIDNPDTFARSLEHMIQISRGEDNQEELLTLLEVKQRSGALTELELVELTEIKISQGLSHLIPDQELGDYLQKAAPSPDQLAQILQARINSQGWAAAKEFSDSVRDQVSFNLTTAQQANLIVLQARLELETSNYEAGLALLESVLSEAPLHCEALQLSADIYSRQEQFEVADAYLRRVEIGSTDCHDEKLVAHAKIVFDRGDYAAALDMYQRDARQKWIAGTVENPRHSEFIETLTELVQLGDR